MQLATLIDMEIKKILVGMTSWTKLWANLHEEYCDLVQNVTPGPHVVTGPQAMKQQTRLQLDKKDIQSATWLELNQHRG